MNNSISSKVLSLIQDDIMTGQISGGDIISERSLVERYHVSRTPIREAFTILEREGWIEITPRQETRVTHFGLNELTEILPVRLSLESLAIELCIRNMDEALHQECEILKNDLQALKEVLHRNDPDERSKYMDLYNALDNRVHSMLYNNCNNRTLKFCFEHMRSTLRRTYRLIPLEYERMLAGIDELIAYITFFANGESMLAEVQMRAHITNSYLQKAAFFSSQNGSKSD